MKSNQFLGEGFVEDASDVHQDHEVQMARAELFHAAEDALALHKLLRNVSEMQGLEGWVSSKITLAADYLNTVREYMEYQLMTGDVNPDIHAAPGVLAIAEGKGSGYTYKDTDDGTYITNTMGETLYVPDVSLFNQGFKQGDRRLPEVWQMNLEMSDETGAYIVGSEEDDNEDGQLNEISADVAKSYLDKRTAQHNPNLNSLETDPRDAKIAQGMSKAGRRVHGFGPQANQQNKVQDRFNYRSNTGTTHVFNKGVAEDSLAEYGNTSKGQMMLTKVQKRAVDRVTSKKADTDPKYAKKNKETADRAWDRMKDVAENAGSVATVVNPTPKNKAKVGTLFGGTYKQKKAK